MKCLIFHYYHIDRAPIEPKSISPGEIEVKGKGHAEATIIDYSLKNQLEVAEIAASRPVCPTCATTIKTNQPNANIITPLKKTKPTPKDN